MVLAHVGHWWTELLYMSPVAVVGLWLLGANVREKRRLAREQRLADAAPGRDG